MRYILLTLLLASCTHRQPIKVTHTEKVMQCMERFSDRGYSAEGVVLICGEVFKERK